MEPISETAAAEPPQFQVKVKLQGGITKEFDTLPAAAQWLEQTTDSVTGLEYALTIEPGLRVRHRLYIGRPFRIKVNGRRVTFTSTNRGGQHPTDYLVQLDQAVNYAFPDLDD